MSFVKEIKSERGKTQIVHENYKFSKHRCTSTNETVWRCIKRPKCNVYVYTVGEPGGFSVTTVRNEHNHGPEENIARQILSVACKRKAEEDLTERPTKIVHKELTSSNFSETLKCRDLKCIKENMYNARRKTLPTLPRSAHEVHSYLTKHFYKTSREENFVLENDLEKGIIIFGCKTNLQFLCKSEFIYMDGTFKYCTKFFTQLFTIHGYLNGHYIPLVFSLLKDKKEETYRLCLEKIKFLCSVNNLHFIPKKVVVDFEIATHNAVRKIWDNITIIGCRFHLTQSWWRKIQKLGLSCQYKDKNSEIGNWLRYCFGLVFLDPNLVSDFFVFELLEIKPNDDRLTAFADYLVDHYISDEATFPPHIWADASSALNKTTNACESFHSHLNNSFYYSSPTIFYFIDVLLKFQTEVYIKCNSVATSCKSKNSATRRQQDFLQKLLTELKCQKISTLYFVKVVSNVYGHNP